MEPIIIIDNNEVLVFNPIYDIDDVIRWGNGDYSKEY